MGQIVFHALSVHTVQAQVRPRSKGLSHSIHRGWWNEGTERTE